LWISGKIDMILKQTGIYRTTWDATGFPSGVYFYRLATEGFANSFMTSNWAGMESSLGLFTHGGMA
jgi:hypothetical protein